MKKRAGLLFSTAMLLVLSALLSACGGQTQGALTGDDVVRNVREALRANQTAQGTIELSAKLNKEGLKALFGNFLPPGAKHDTGTVTPDWTAMLPNTATATLKVWRESPDKMRVEVVSSTLPDLKGVTLVYDGKKVYAYISSHNKVYIKTPSAEGDMMLGPLAGEWGAMTPEERGDKLVAASDVKLLGSEQAGGKDSYKLEVTAKAGALDKLGVPAMFQMMLGGVVKDAKATVWVDKERFVPLKATVEHPQVGQFTYSATLDLEKPIDAAQFILQTPAGAETVDLDALREQTQPKSMTLPQAREEVAKDGWKLLEPTYLPEKATLVEVRRLGLPPGATGWHEGESSLKERYMPSDYLLSLNDPTLLVGTLSAQFSLDYSSPTADFSLLQGMNEIAKGLGDGFSGVNGDEEATKKLTVRGVTAIAFSPDGSRWTSLHWQDKGGIYVTIRGRGGLTLEEAMKIAEGLR